MKKYSKAPSGVAERVAHLVKLFHSDVQLAGVIIDLISVADDDPDVENVLKVRGIPAYATCRAVDIKGRTMGRGDVEIVIDESKYLTQPDATKDAILGHELEHIELQLTKKGRLKLDGCGRPKIKMRPHDAEFGWFVTVAERYGVASIECKQATQLFLNHTQTFFAFVGEGQKQLEASPRLSADMARAARRFVDGVKASGITTTISSGGHKVTIDKDGVRGEPKEAATT